MAKQNLGINDGFHGKVGTVVGYQWRGIWVARACAKVKSNPRTERQQGVRRRLAEWSRLASAMKSVLRVGLHDEAMAQHMTECNLFMRLNVAALGGDEVDFGALVVSYGPVATVSFGAVEVEGGMCRVPLGAMEAGVAASADDEVHLYAFCPSAGEGRQAPPVYRCAACVVVALPDAWRGQEVHLYGFVRQFSGSTSLSTHIATLLW